MDISVRTFLGKSFLSSATDWHQYAAVFSLMSSMLRKELRPGPNRGPEVVPRTIRGDTLVTRSFGNTMKKLFQMMAFDVLLWDIWLSPPYPVQTSWSERSPNLVQKLFWSWPCWWWEEQRRVRMGLGTLSRKPQRWCLPGLLRCRTTAALGLCLPSVHEETGKEQIQKNWKTVFTTECGFKYTLIQPKSQHFMTLCRLIPCSTIQ